MLKPTDIPNSFPVKPLTETQADQATRPVTCCVCGLTWDDGVATAYTPTPAARCPFEDFHTDDGGSAVAQVIAAPAVLDALRGLVAALPDLTGLELDEIESNAVDDALAAIEAAGG